MSERSYKWRDINQGYGVYHYEVKFYDDGFLKGVQYSVGRPKLQAMVQDWMDGKPIKITKEKLK